MGSFVPSRNSPEAVPVMLMFSTSPQPSTHPSMPGHATSKRVMLCTMVLLFGALSTSAPRTCRAQPTVDIGGLAYFDYTYLINTPVADAEGWNTFDYRRIYLTTDFTLSDEFSGRVRLEAQGRVLTEQGRPAPFVKDAYLAWQDPIGEGSRLRFGVQPPPVFEVSERTWGYRSLDKTIMDRVGANDSRDFGIRADVSLAGDGAIRLAGMFANGNGVRPEAIYESGKHLYAQIQAFPGDVLRMSVGTDYLVVDGEGDIRTGILKASAFVGAESESFHGGVEAFYLRTTFDDLIDTFAESVDGVGVSVFGTLNISDQTSVVGRYDFVNANARRSSVDEHYGLAAFVYRPDPHVELIPNVVIFKEDLDNVDAAVVGRFTVHVKF